MKRFRLYTQTHGRLKRLSTRWARQLHYKKCGYDNFDEAFAIVKELWRLNTEIQVCIVDFDSGDIVALNMKLRDDKNCKYVGWKG